MDRKYLEENNLINAHNQFMRLCEWSYVKNVTEDDTEEPQGNQQGEEQPMEDPMQQQGDMGTQGDSMGMDNQMGADQQGMNGGQDMMGADQNQDMGGEMPMDNGMQQDMGMDDTMPMDDEEQEPEEEDDVIDVDDITNAQEKMNKKVNSVGKDVEGVEDTIGKLAQALKKVEDMIDSNNEKIEQFQQEFEKRNPTETEKLNLRSLDSYPYNVNPKEYWDSKAESSNYSAYGDNQEPTTKEYVITNSDVDDFDERAIADSFKIDDDLDQDIAKIFGL